MKTKKCPYCSEEILVDAKKCKHCGEYLTNDVKPAPQKVVVENKSSGAVTVLVVLAIIVLLCILI